MAEERKILVSDTSILIDLCEIDLLDPFFDMDIATFTSLFVMNEVENKDQLSAIEKHIKSGKLSVDNPSAMSLQSAAARFQAVPKLGLTDCSLIELASRLGCGLLTCDRVLKTEALKLGIRVNGLLWTVEEMVAMNVLSKSEGISRIELLSAKNTRAPRQECVALIESWRD